MKLFEKMICVFMLILVALSCIGCDNSNELNILEPVNIAFVVGIADDETKVETGIEELAMLPAIPGSDYAFISAEGEPACIGEPGTVVDLSDRGYSKAMMDRITAGIQGEFAGRLTDYEPKSSQIDMAAATAMAVQNLNANQVEGRENILVYYCSGRSTTGLINMTQTPIYKMDVDASVAAIAESMKIDLSSVDRIVWYCCGESGGDQERFSNFEKDQLKTFYKKLFRALGAREVIFKDNLPSTDYYRFDATPVSPIPVQGVTSALMEYVELTEESFQEADPQVLSTPIVIQEQQVKFKGDSAELLHPDLAQETLQPVAEFLRENSDVEILLYGTCAGDKNTAVTFELGRSRAETIKALLVQMGDIDENRITVCSIGIEADPFYQYGRGLGSEGSVNRKTVILDMGSDLARQILAAAV